MATHIQTPRDMATAPIGTAIAHTSKLNSLEVAVKTAAGWEVTGRLHVIPPQDYPEWIGADLLLRKVDVIGWAQRLDSLNGQGAAA